MDEKKPFLSTIMASPQKFLRKIWIALCVAFFPVLFLFIFGFSIKTTPEYDCAVQLVETNRQVNSVTGSPVKPGQFAWTKYFESSGMTRQGVFFTSISGPRGSGRIDVEFYRSPVGESINIWFTSKDVEMEIYSGAYPCPE